jgi:hypothetical protein
MQRIDHNADYYIELINNGTPFSFARYGDGEMILMFNTKAIIGRDAGDMYKAVEPMKQIFRNQHPYYHCEIDCTFSEWNLHCFGVDVKDVRKFFEETCPDMQWYYGEVWQLLAAEGRIAVLMDALSKKSPVFIGGEHLERLEHVDGMTNMNLITVHDRKAWDDYDNIKEQIIEYINKGYKLFCFSMGYPGKIMIDELFPKYGDTCTFIDFGSVFDPFCGLLSRAGMKATGYPFYQQFTKFTLPNG